MLHHRVNFDPGEPLETLLARIPAAWCVYLMADAQDRPVQLLCVKNLRASLRRRLGEEAATDPTDSTAGPLSTTSAPSRRIDYRALVRRVSWTRVDSAFEQDLVYLETARRAFPESYAGVLGFRSAWWIHTDPSADRPRVARSTSPGAAPGDFFGPIPDKNAAQKLVHHVEDLFDLCRDPAALAAAPAGPCQWRQMGKCVGPCDGSIGLPAYRALVAHAADTLADVGRAVERHELRMRQAAAALQFEAAGGIKAFIDKLDALRQGPFRHLRRLGDFRFLAVMPGRRKDTAKLFVVTPGEIHPLACLRQPPTKGRGEEILRLALEAAAPPSSPPAPPTAAGQERLSLVAHHLFPTRRTPGVFIPMADLEDKSLAAAFREANRPRKEPASTTTATTATADEEGEVRGLQVL